VEAGWDRATAFVELSDAEIGTMIEPIGAGLTAVTRLSSGLANTNYRVDLDDGRRVVLRLYTRSPEVAATEAAVLRLVAGSVPAPEMLFTDSEGRRTGRVYAIMTWLEGALLQDALPGAGASRQQAIGHSAGETLVRIQSHRFDRPGFFSSDGRLRPSGALPPFGGHIAACLLRDGGAANLGPELTQRVLGFVDRNSGLLPQDEPVVLVHGDYKASNLLVSGEGDECRTSGVLDWEFSFAGPRLFDLTMLLRYSDTMPEFEAGVVEGYRAAGGVLEAGWKQRVRLLDFTNLCGFLTGSNRGDQRVRDVTALIERTMERWESYGES
jgi:aminoglycoside phosphotransferase (APT) family kinase protein